MNKVSKLKFNILYENSIYDNKYYLLYTTINNTNDFFILFQYNNNYEYIIYDENSNKYFEIPVEFVNSVDLILPPNIYNISFHNNTKGFYFSKNNISLHISNNFNDFKIEIPKFKKILNNIN